jgi:hypothetical protein
MIDTATETDGRTDFDFLLGKWRSRNRKLANLLDPECRDWVEVEAHGETRPILGGLGNLDEGHFSSGSSKDGGPFDGVTLRLFDPEAGVWRIWWASSTFPGRLDEPVEGRFEDGQGLFFAEDELVGRRIGVRYEWKDITPASARWEQAFSYDEGQSWHVNWITELELRPAEA